MAKLTYVVTGRFPRSERFELSAQMRRAAISIGSNIAEGGGRGGNVALVSFLQIALGSASELEYQLGLACDLEFVTRTDAAPLAHHLSDVKRMLSRLIVAIRGKGDRLTPASREQP